MMSGLVCDESRVVSKFDVLTEKAPYPACHANFEIWGKRS